MTAIVLNIKLIYYKIRSKWSIWNTCWRYLRSNKFYSNSKVVKTFSVKCQILEKKLWDTTKTNIWKRTLITYAVYENGDREIERKRGKTMRSLAKYKQKIHYTYFYLQSWKFFSLSLSLPSQFFLYPNMFCFISHPLFFRATGDAILARLDLSLYCFHDLKLGQLNGSWKVVSIVAIWTHDILVISLLP